jgi:hypothetical protein
MLLIECHAPDRRFAESSRGSARRSILVPGKYYPVLRFDVSRRGFTDSKSALSEAVEENIGIRGQCFPASYDCRAE